MMIFDPPLSRISVETGVFHTPSGRPLILVVDDYPANITMLYEILERDCEVCMATSGQAALAFCEGRRPDLILLDIMMPEMDGYEVCRHLKDNDLTRDIPIIFVTTKSDPSEETRGLDLGAVDFISKPFHTKIVRARVRTHLTLQLQAEALRSLAMIDGLTGIANRRQFDTILSAEWHRCIRSHSAMSLVLIDIDFFKRYNDYYGHQAGDECIRTIAATLKKNLRRSHDMVAKSLPASCPIRNAKGHAQRPPNSKWLLELLGFLMKDPMWSGLSPSVSVLRLLLLRRVMTPQVSLRNLTFNSMRRSNLAARRCMRRSLNSASV